MSLFGKKDTKKIPEKRNYVRAVSRDLIKFRGMKLADKDSVSNIVDISAGGLRVLVHKKPHVGEEFTAIINLGDSDAVMTVRCMVKNAIPWNERRGSYFMGAQFIDLSDDETAIFVRYINNKELKKKRVA